MSEGHRRAERAFDASILKEPLEVLPTRDPLCFARDQFVSEAMHAMQKEHRGCVLITEGGGFDSPLVGIFTERDVLYRIIDRGRNPATLPLAEVMTRSPDVLLAGTAVAFVLNRMAVGGFRHVPVVDEQDRPVAIVSVRDVVEFLVDHFPREVMNLPPEAGGNISSSREGASPKPLRGRILPSHVNPSGGWAVVRPATGRRPRPRAPRRTAWHEHARD